MIEKSSLNQPYRHSRYEPAMLSTQYDEEETTAFAFSDLSHWNNVLAEKKNCARNPVELGLAGRSRIVPYGHLKICASLLKQDEGRQKPVHSREQWQFLCRIRMHHLERTTRVGCAVVRHHAAEAVGKLGLEPFEEGILAGGPDSRDHSVFFYVLKQEIEVFRICLQVCIDIADIFGESMVDSGFQRSRQAIIPVKADIHEAAVVPADFFEPVQTAVGRTVVDEKYACVHSAAVCKCPETKTQPVHVLDFIIDRHDHGKVKIRCPVHVSQMVLR